MICEWKQSYRKSHRFGVSRKRIQVSRHSIRRRGKTRSEDIVMLRMDVVMSNHIIRSSNLQIGSVAGPNAPHNWAALHKKTQIIPPAGSGQTPLAIPIGAPYRPCGPKKARLPIIQATPPMNHTART